MVVASEDVAAGYVPDSAMGHRNAPSLSDPCLAHLHCVTAAYVLVGLICRAYDCPDAGHDTCSLCFMGPNSLHAVAFKMTSLSCSA